ncbi:MAG TPA: hypothetical protein VGK67_08915 [Myxococcales bacterium]
MSKSPRSPLLLTLACALLAGCPKPSTPVTVGGHRLDPASNVFWSGTQGSADSTKVILSDLPNLCELYEKADACTEAAQAATPGEGTYLALTVSGKQAGEYEVAGKDSSRRADVVFLVRSATAVTYKETALSGVVTFTALTPGEGVAGRYTLKMSGGGTLEGDFGGDPCGNLDRLVQRLAQSQPSCSSDYTPTACTAKCSCTTRSNTADCVRLDSSSDWECTCVRSGERTKCAVPKSEANVCTQGNGCCDTSF